MQNSYQPLGSLVMLSNMSLDEVIIGCPGSGLSYLAALALGPVAEQMAMLRGATF